MIKTLPETIKLTVFRRAKIKLLAKRSIETGEECDAIPESMRQYLAYQAMESSKALGRSLPIRGADALTAYRGGDMFLGGESHNPTKTGESHVSHRELASLTVRSHRPHGLSRNKHRQLEASRCQRHGSRCLLFSRQSLHDVLHQQ